MLHNFAYLISIAGQRTLGRLVLRLTCCSWISNAQAETDTQSSLLGNWVETLPSATALVTVTAQLRSRATLVVELVPAHCSEHLLFWKQS